MSSWPTSCPAPLSKHTGKEFNFRSMPKIWEASQHIIIITILMYAEIIVCTINQLFIYSSRSTGISYGSCEKGPLDCEDTLSNISKTSEGYLKVFVVSTSADARSNAVYGKISAQPHPTLCIQFLNRENNDKNNTLPLGKQICFTIVWGCAEILPNR